MCSLLNRSAPRGMAEALRAFSRAVSCCISHRRTLVCVPWAPFTSFVPGGLLPCGLTSPVLAGLKMDQVNGLPSVGNV